MITLRRITDAGNAEFRKLMKVYEEAFPEEERRDIGQLEKLLRQKRRCILMQWSVMGV